MRRRLRALSCEKSSNIADPQEPAISQALIFILLGVFSVPTLEANRKNKVTSISVEFEETADLSLLDFIGIENYLSDFLGIKVDLVEKHTLKPRIGGHVLEEVVRI